MKWDILNNLSVLYEGQSGSLREDICSLVHSLERDMISLRIGRYYHVGSGVISAIGIIEGRKGFIPFAYNYPQILLTEIFYSEDKAWEWFTTYHRFALIGLAYEELL